MNKPDCHNLGLTQGQRAALAGFTYRTVAALAHLREAWCIADPSNRRAVEGAINALLQGHSMRESHIRGICARVLRQGLDDGQACRLLQEVDLLQWVLANQYPVGREQ